MSAASAITPEINDAFALVLKNIATYSRPARQRVHHHLELGLDVRKGGFVERTAGKDGKAAIRE